MKQHFNLFLIVALIAMLAAGCHKEEQATVTLGAKIQKPISGDSKVYIDDHTPCWHNGDMVYINDAAYPVMAASGSSAQIENVTASSSYRAVFPAGIVPPCIDINANSSIPVTLPSVQRYELVGGHQRVDVPMGAYLTSGNTLQFFNLCSVVRITVSNSLNQELPLRHIAMKTASAMLSGAGTAMVVGTVSTSGGSESANHIEMSGTASHSVCLGFTEDYPVTVPARGSKTFDIVVPAFTTDNITFTLYTTDGYYFEMTKTDKALAHNTLTTVTMNVTRLTQIVAAELVDGPTFNAAIPDNATAVVFEYNNPAVTSGTLLSTTDSPTPIYGNLDPDGTTWRVSTAAHMMNANSNCDSMFCGRWGNGVFLSLERIDFGEGFNTQNVTKMIMMFSGCLSLTNLDVSHFNTENVTEMSMMFHACQNLTRLDVSNFNTENVIGMGGMFEYCRNLISLDVSHFNTDNVIGMQFMFENCNSLTSLDVSHFNTDNVVNMEFMFYNCSNLTRLDVSNFNTSNVTDMHYMFYDCRGLTSLDVSNFNTRNVTDMSYMFYGCRNLTRLDVSHFNTENVVGMFFMFCNCSNLTSLDVSHFNTENVTSMYSMFWSCSRLTSLDVSHFNTENVTDMGEMFNSCHSLTSLDVSHFNTENVTFMRGMFSYCNSLTNLDISSFITDNVTNMNGMFYACSGLTNLNLSNFNTENVTDMSGMFSNCRGLTRLNLSNFDMSHLGDNNILGKEQMCSDLSTTSGHCTITCPQSVKDAIEERNDDNEIITGLPTSGVTFNWTIVSPSSK